MVVLCGLWRTLVATWCVMDPSDPRVLQESHVVVLILKRNRGYLAFIGLEGLCACVDSTTSAGSWTWCVLRASESTRPGVRLGSTYTRCTGKVSYMWRVLCSLPLPTGRTSLGCSMRTPSRVDVGSSPWLAISRPGTSSTPAGSGASVCTRGLGFNMTE